MSRFAVESTSRRRGCLRPTAIVGGKTDLVIAADPDSLSGKAREARELGVPIVGYDACCNMLESLGEQGLGQEEHRVGRSEA
jgi:hypothetical protein